MVQSVNNISALNVSEASAMTSRERAIAAVKQAADQTGVDFSYLLDQAKQESGLNTNAKASTSSATGLFQFIDQTWLQTVKRHGEEHGLSEYADKITINADGVAQVANAADKKAILALRTNPEVSSLMAAELANDNKASLAGSVDGEVGATDLYMAHFLGAGCARKFLTTLQDNPNATAAAILPSAAQANKNVFYDSKTGQARSVSEVYAFFDRKFGGTAQTETVQVASADTYSLPLDSDDELTTRALRVYAVGNGVTIDETTSSSLATTLLAQMDIENFGLDVLEKMNSVEITSSYSRAYNG